VLYLSDTTFLIYFWILLMCITGFLLYATEWVRVGHASWAFKYVMFFLLGTGVANIANLYARWRTLLGEFPPVWEWWWPCRNLITLVFVTAFVVHVSFKIFVRKGLIDYEPHKKKQRGRRNEYSTEESPERCSAFR